jgi:hypothetical protein
MGPTPTAFDTLREATSALRAQIETGRYSRALNEGTLPIAKYASFLRALHAVYAELEHAVATCSLEVLRRVHGRCVERRGQLEGDLQSLGVDLQGVDAAVLSALVLAQRMRLDAAHDLTALFGYVEVMEGSQLTCLTRGPAIESLAYIGDAERDAFLASLEAMLPGTALGEATTGAQHALEGLAALLDVVISGRYDEGMASVLNREAGLHPVPRDLREVQAALFAGERSRETWAYYQARYGERGHRFTRSDSAWLVTLVRESPEQARRQITWLARVLATRGMPQLLLERHLEELHAQLSELVPERSADYASLRNIAAEMANSRRTLLSDEDSETLAREFAFVTDQAPLPPLEAGQLLVAAVLDETRGIPDAVESLCRWLNDPARTSAAWRDAVERTLSRVRTACRL